MEVGDGEDAGCYVTAVGDWEEGLAEWGGEGKGRVGYAEGWGKGCTGSYAPIGREEARVSVGVYCFYGGCFLESRHAEDVANIC